MFETPEPLKALHKASQVLDALAGDTDPPGEQEEWYTTAPLHWAYWKINCVLGPLYQQMKKDAGRIAELEEYVAKLEVQLYHDGPTFEQELLVCQSDLEKMTQRWRNARAEERERCAKWCEDNADLAAARDLDVHVDLWETAASGLRNLSNPSPRG